MICPHCKFEQSAENTECLKCGIVFEKYFAQPESLSRLTTFRTPPEAKPPQQETVTTIPEAAKKLLLHVTPAVNPIYFGGRVLTFLVIFIWGWKFILTPMESNYVGHSFLHLVNLPFHEAGHIIFSPFGRFIGVLGGTLGQLLMPLTCLLVLLIKTRDTFGASVALWWLGESFMDIAPYINDARALNLALLAGVTGRDVPDYHDWEFILRSLGLLEYDHALAHFSYGIGILLMLATFVWGIYLLWKQYENLDTA